MFETFVKIVGVTVVFVAAIVIFAIIGAIPTYYLWNWLAPTLFGFRQITLFQAWGLNALCAILFKTSSSSSK